VCPSSGVRPAGYSAKMHRRDHLERLRASSPLILPSLLQCDFAHLADEIRQLEDAGVSALHLDVMDGVFVPNFTYGMTIVAAVRKVSQLPLDVHLMIEKPQRYAKAFADAGADVITFHVEACDEPRKLLEEVRDLDCIAGVALNPGTPIRSLEPFIDLCDLVLVMSVDAGFGGQAFNPMALQKIEQLKQSAASDLLIEIDGGVNQHTIRDCVESGAQLVVVGSAIFKAPSYRAAIDELSKLAVVAA
jgi:ribulose-phosphate 3-epimerase